MTGPVVILGLGFTTQRLAARLRRRGIPVYALTRNPERFAKFARTGVSLHGLVAEGIPQRSVLVHSIPPVPEPENSSLRALIAAIAPRRIVYISSTGVYGTQSEVNEETPAEPNDEKGLARLADENWLQEFCADTLILRSAAIYGPGRGIHVRLREGKLPRGAGGVVSRIHVDDLVSILEAGIESQIRGAWPVADNCPENSDEVAAWTASLMNLTLPPDSAAPTFPVSGRSVDARKIREMLGIALRFPSFKTGIPASLREEDEANLGD
jgi:nucleoside-diphosphate-sugar epimerase